MITKSQIVGLLIVLGVGFLVFRPGDEPADSQDRDGDSSESATDRQFQPREPEFLEQDREYGIAGRSRTREAPPSYDWPNRYPPEPYTQSYPGVYGATGSFGAQAPFSTNDYRFRPLGEQEQRRAEQTQYPEQYPTPYYRAPAAQQRQVAPSHYSAPYQAPQQETYSFRPLDKTRASRGRWQGPYQQPGWRDDRAPIDPWTAPPNPQWGSTPPAQRMYPRFYRDPSTRLTAR